ncbi:MAG: MFS transporter [Proteobacteria bacterium]|nr:MFS transporter [Pseudomonadota bacterium]
MNRRGIALIASSHVVDDIYQGVVPAMLPFFVAERGYSYAAIAGLTLAATVFSSVAQPLFGWWADRHAARWLVWVGFSTAAIGVGWAGVSASYEVTWAALALSGLGVAAFHPEAARVARQAAGSSNQGMSIFALGGNAGFALGTVIATPVFLALGLRGTPLLLAPAAVMAIIVIARLNHVIDRPSARSGRLALPTGRDNWASFALLTTTVILRSVMFFGISSFLALYFIHHLHTSKALGNASLSVFLVAGAVGTVLGGVIGDRYGRLASMRLGFALAIPSLIALVLADNVWLCMVFVAIGGIATYLPFAVMVMLGQDYLPNRIGTASGVTVGLSVSIGGLANPLFGMLADATSLRTTLAVLVIMPAIALALASRLRDPLNRSRDAVGIA